MDTQTSNKDNHWNNKYGIQNNIYFLRGKKGIHRILQKDGLS